MTIPSLLNHQKPARRLVTRGTSTLKAAATAPKREVTDRVLLGSGFIISVKLPPKLNAMTVPTTGEAYKQFGNPVKGGYLNFHLYGEEECQRRGDRVWVSAEVYEKTMDDGKRFIYVDLRPTTEHVTHEMKIYRDMNMMPQLLPEGSATFYCRDHIEGVLAFLPRQSDETPAEA